MDINKEAEQLAEKIVEYHKNYRNVKDDALISCILQYTEKICREQRENCKKVFIDIFFDDEIANDILNAPSPIDNSPAICGAAQK